ncbi:MAG: DoxX family protein [Planctomycetaceae bacterium]|jgi:putative oxidoreductase|nr:MAG: DoxX family protein [Planctomycetaceae bacterium]
MMIVPLDRFQEPVYAAMRIVVGLLFMMNGAQKLFGSFGGKAVAIASMPGAAGVIEFVGGLLVMFGLLTGIAAFIASGEMAFAYFIIHYPQGGWPIQNGGQLAVLFCFIFLFIAARGAGMLSLDRVLFARSSSRMRVAGT